jgi:hypothetical protein
MAYAARNRAHQHFPILRLVDLDLLDRQGLLRGMKNRSFHLSSFRFRVEIAVPLVQTTPVASMSRNP